MLQKSAAFPSLLTALMLVVGSSSILLPASEVRAEMNMPGMNDTKGKAAKNATATGTIISLNTAGRKVTLDHAPMPEINWPAMKMEFPVAASVDLSKLRTGDKVRFTVSGSGSNYTVQSITSSP
jgi:Cu(I)/Ag(I) efflux system periplasmic protein CusF